MKVLIVNPIIYTSETAIIKRAPSIKDTMIYDLCLAFIEKGHKVTLFAAEPYRPVKEEEYPFDVIWAKCKFTKICKPNVFPYCPSIKKTVCENDYDLIISSEVFSINSLMLAFPVSSRVKKHVKDKVIIWHELAKHNNIFRKIPSKIWYNIVARLFLKNVTVIPRSEEARSFISKYCKNVKDTIIDHGVNLNKFTPSEEKGDYFIVSSQLIERKQIHKIIKEFYKFSKAHGEFKLFIFGEGDKEEELKALVREKKLDSKVIFFGKVSHGELKKHLAKARAMLVYTRKDNNMVSIVESIACATPVITTSVPYNASYIKANSLGIVNDSWDEKDLEEICKSKDYIKNCIEYRNTISTLAKVDLFLNA